MTFQNAKIVGWNVSPQRYLWHGLKRGDPQYHISRSDLMEIARCPHRWIGGYREDGTDSTDWGNLVDTLLLSPGCFDDRYSIVPETYRDEKGNDKPWNFNANACKEWRAHYGKGQGYVEVKKAELAEAKIAAHLLKEDYETSILLENAKTQVMVAADYLEDDSDSLIPVRGLIDIVPNGQSHKQALADLKTSVDASVHSWPRTVHRYGLHVQAALYLDLWNAATGEERFEWLHVIQENFPPYEIGRRLLSQSFVNLGRSIYRDALRRYAWCLKNNDWPTYDDMAGNIIPGWTLTEPEEWMVQASMQHMVRVEPIPTVKPKEDELREVIP